MFGDLPLQKYIIQGMLFKVLLALKILYALNNMYIYFYLYAEL